MAMSLLPEETEDGGAEPRPWRMAIPLIFLGVVLVGGGAALWNLVAVPRMPIARLAQLDGCYEGAGLPDFMRPRIHWVMRVREGEISNRAGEVVARMELQPGAQGTQGKALVRFTPGIVIGKDAGGSGSVYRGDTVLGEAYLWDGRATISLSDSLLLKTDCG
jgi:hypothetical protein